MKTFFIAAGAFIAGAAVSGAATYFFVKGSADDYIDRECLDYKAYYDEKHEALKEKYIRESSDYWKLRAAVEMFCDEQMMQDILAQAEITMARQEDLDREVDEGEEEEESHIENALDDGYSTLRYQRTQKDVTQYNRVSATYRGRTVPEKPPLTEFEMTEQDLAEREYPRDDEEDDPVKVVPITERTVRDPFVIDEEMFAMDDFQEKVTVTYYEGDDTLCDEDESIMQIGDTIGWNALEDICDKDVIYVRNEKLGIDYEVCLDERSYAEYIMGIPLDQPPRRRRRVSEDDEN